MHERTRFSLSYYSKLECVDLGVLILAFSRFAVAAEELEFFSDEKDSRKTDLNFR